MHRGRLIYLMGPSGSGKDSVLDAARAALQQRGVEVARRVITRSAEARGEDAVAVTPERFLEMKTQGAFALDWAANGLSYGIPREVDDWLHGGKSVLVNGSREYLPIAARMYPGLLPVMLIVSTPVLRERLRRRGREGMEEIEARLERNERLLGTAQQLAQAGEGGDLLVLDNSGPLEQTVAMLIAWLTQRITLINEAGD